MTRGSDPTVLVFGAGALGLTYGCFLAEAGLSVSLVGRAVHKAAAEAEGIRTTGIWGEHAGRPAAYFTDAGDARGPFDLALVCTKSHDTADAAPHVARLVSPDGAVVSVQNGLGNWETLAEAVGPEKVYGARVIFGAEVTGPARTRVTVSAAPVLVGAAFSGDTARAEQLARLFSRCGIETHAADDITAHLWGKVIYNAALNALGALLGVPYGRLGEIGPTRRIMQQVIREAYAVAAALGVKPPAGSADEYIELFYDRLLPPTAAHRSSMLQDLAAGRRTEVDAINGRIAELGRERGVPCPVNELLTLLVHARENLR